MLTFRGALLTVLAITSLLFLGPDFSLSMPGHSTFDEVLVEFLTAVELALSAWILLCLVCAVGARHSELLRTLSHAITPALMRRILFIGAAGMLTVNPAHANSPQGTSSGNNAASHPLDGLPMPHRPLGSAPAKPREGSASDTVTVRSGDTLWSIAASDLGNGAGPSDIATATDRWHQQNLDVIGPDPNLIFPQQVLQRPAKETS